MEPEVTEHLTHELYVTVNQSEVRLYCLDCSERLYKRVRGRYGLAPIPKPILYKPLRGENWQQDTE